MLNLTHPVLLASGKLRIFNFLYGILDQWIVGKAEYLFEWHIPQLRDNNPSSDQSPSIGGLMFLVALQALRKCLSTASIMLRQGEITPVQMVTYILRLFF